MICKNDQLNYNSGSSCACAVAAADYKVQGTTASSNLYGSIDGISVINAIDTRVYNSNLSNWDYGITLNEDAVKEIVEKITKERELAKITPDNGPEIPKWTGFLPI